MHNLYALLTFTLLSSLIIITRAHKVVYTLHALRTVHTWIGNAESNRNRNNMCKKKHTYNVDTNNYRYNNAIILLLPCTLKLKRYRSAEGTFTVLSSELMIARTRIHVRCLHSCTYDVIRHHSNMDLICTNKHKSELYVQHKITHTYNGTENHRNIVGAKMATTPIKSQVLKCK